MSVVVKDGMEKLYHNTLIRAMGSRGLNEFARHAGISAGNLSKMLSGQIALNLIRCEKLLMLVPICRAFMRN